MLILDCTQVVPAEPSLPYPLVKGGNPLVWLMEGAEWSHHPFLFFGLRFPVALIFAFDPVSRTSLTHVLQRQSTFSCVDLGGTLGGHEEASELV